MSSIIRGATSTKLLPSHGATVSRGLLSSKRFFTQSSSQQKSFKDKAKGIENPSIYHPLGLPQSAILSNKRNFDKNPAEKKVFKQAKVLTKYLKVDHPPKRRLQPLGIISWDERVKMMNVYVEEGIKIDESRFIMGQIDQNMPIFDRQNVELNYFPLESIDEFRKSKLKLDHIAVYATLLEFNQFLLVFQRHHEQPDQEGMERKIDTFAVTMTSVNYRDDKYGKKDLELFDRFVERLA